MFVTSLQGSDLQSTKVCVYFFLISLFRDSQICFISRLCCSVCVTAKCK
uniref:Uncharacterized protein n=1 Tax=Anguilla anguilla TaxID=7936 RepID=A0A0E9TYS5_ANGAN